MTIGLSFNPFGTKKGCFSFLLFLVLAFIPFYGLSQETKNFIVEGGAHKIWNKGPIITEKLIIRGELTIADRTDMDITVSQVIIDGGTLNIGSAEKAFEHKLNFLFQKSRTDGFVGIEIKNKGSISIHGAVRDSILTSLSKEANPERQKSLDRNISIKTSDTETDAIVYVEDAKEVVLSGVLFDGMGSNTEPALHWKGATLHKSQVSNSAFLRSKSDDILLDGTSIDIVKNYFISNNGSSIICSPSEATVNNRLESNLIDNRSGKGTYVMEIYNPYQTIRDNRIITRNETHGIGLLSSSLVNGYLKNATHTTLELENNRLRHIDETGANEKKKNVIGLKIDAFAHTGIWRTKANKIVNFKYGCIVSSQNTVLDGFHFIDNTIGIIPGTAYVQNTKIENRKEVDVKDTKAMWVTDSYGTSAPKVSHLTIDNYGVGIHFDGTVAPENYFEKIDFLHTPLVSFEVLHPSSIIKVKDASFVAKKVDSEYQSAHSAGIEHSSHTSMDHGQLNITEPSKHEMHAGMNPSQHASMERSQHAKSDQGQHDMHAALHSSPKRASGYHLFPEESILVSEQSKSFRSKPDIFISVDDNFGNLTISTGFGLLDPIHEHGGELREIEIKNIHTTRTRSFGKPSNRHEIFLAANTHYELFLGENERHYYDLSFEWEAPSESWILLQVPYTYNKAYGMRSFGNLIPPSTDMDELRNKEVTSYLVDTENGKVFIKLFGKHNRDELVLYSAEVLTEISVDSKKVPVRIQTNRKENSVELSFGIPAKTNTEIALLDYDGNIVQSLFNDLSPKKNTTVIVDMDKFDVANEVYLYSITVDDETHRGPVHAY